MFSGLLVGLAPAAPAAAGEPCGARFDERLACWSGSIDRGAVHVTLDRAVAFDGDAGNRRTAERDLTRRPGRLVVEVPPGAHTGAGGTVLLILADPTHRLVAKDAAVDPLSTEAVNELAVLGACDPKDDKDPCARLHEGHPLKGADLVAGGFAVDLAEHVYTAGSADPAGDASNPAGTATSGKQGGNGLDDRGGQEGQGDGKGGTDRDGGAAKVTDHATDPVADSGWDTATQVLAVLCAVLVLLLALLLLLIRRSSQAVGTLSRRELAAPGVGGVGPAPAAPARRPRTPDEATTRLRTGPAPRHGRRVGNVSGPVRPAVVRTELHPQGYVEVDHVLYRAVWAEPGRPPPAPGLPVDVTEAGEPDADVLYAFPPTARRHAAAARP
ncbi:hypothetical protein [Streptomyces sp. NPDC002580]|uniref:hypothetical protein n=1 Tax=Streptomyces sp. NPDC002580 TaxID=3364653 RepID=UPI0036B37857